MSGRAKSKLRKNEEQTAQIENSEKLTSEEPTLCRSLVMKLAYVAQGRIDIAEAKTCELKKLGRYLVKKHEVRVDVRTTNIGSNVAGACGL